jgi:hypothetical protein
LSLDDNLEHPQFKTEIYELLLNHYRAFSLASILQFSAREDQERLKDQFKANVEGFLS